MAQQHPRLAIFKTISLPFFSKHLLSQNWRAMSPLVLFNVLPDAIYCIAFKCGKTNLSSLWHYLVRRTLALQARLCLHIRQQLVSCVTLQFRRSCLRHLRSAAWALWPHQPSTPTRGSEYQSGLTCSSHMYDCCCIHLCNCWEG